jgi:hypothetical protein
LETGVATYHHQSYDVIDLAGLKSDVRIAVTPSTPSLQKLLFLGVSAALRDPVLNAWAGSGSRKAAKNAKIGTG